MKTILEQGANTNIVKANIAKMGEYQGEDLGFVLNTDQFNKAVDDLKLEVYTPDAVVKFRMDIQKAAESGSLPTDELEKAKKNLAKLRKVTKVDKNGKKTTVWVKTGEEPKKKEYKSHTAEDVDEIKATIKRQESLLANPKSPAGAKKRAEAILKVERAKLPLPLPTSESVVRSNREFIVKQHPYVKLSGAKDGEHPNVTYGRAKADLKHGTNAAKKAAADYIKQHPYVKLSGAKDGEAAQLPNPEGRKTENLKNFEVVDDGDMPIYSVSIKTPNGTESRFAVAKNGKPATGDPLSKTLDEARSERALVIEDNKRRAVREEGEKAKDQEKQAEVASEKERLSSGFFAGKTPMQAGKLDAALNKTVMLNGKLTTRKEFVEERVKAGGVIGNTKKFGRVLEDSSGSFMSEADITKTAMDYAEYLIDQGGQKSDKQSDFKVDWRSHDATKSGAQKYRTIGKVGDESFELTGWNGKSYSGLSMLDENKKVTHTFHQSIKTYEEANEIIGRTLDGGAEDHEWEEKKAQKSDKQSDKKKKEPVEESGRNRAERLHKETIKNLASSSYTALQHAYATARNSKNSAQAKKVLTEMERRRSVDKDKEHKKDTTPAKKTTDDRSNIKWDMSTTDRSEYPKQKEVQETLKKVGRNESSYLWNKDPKDWDKYDLANYNKYKSGDIKKAIEMELDRSLDILEKAGGKKNLAKLKKVTKTDKNGKKSVVWVKANEDPKKEKKTSKEQEKPAKKAGKEEDPKAERSGDHEALITKKKELAEKVKQTLATEKDPDRRAELTTHATRLEGEHKELSGEGKKEAAEKSGKVESIANFLSLYQDNDMEDDFYEVVSKHYTPEDDGESEYTMMKNLEKLDADTLDKIDEELDKKYESPEDKENTAKVRKEEGEDSGDKKTPHPLNDRIEYAKKEGFGVIDVTDDSYTTKHPDNGYEVKHTIHPSGGIQQTSMGDYKQNKDSKHGSTPEQRKFIENYNEKTLKDSGYNENMTKFLDEKLGSSDPKNVKEKMSNMSYSELYKFHRELSKVKKPKKSKDDNKDIKKDKEVKKEWQGDASDPYGASGDWKESKKKSWPKGSKDKSFNTREWQEIEDKLRADGWKGSRVDPNGNKWSFEHKESGAKIITQWVSSVEKKHEKHKIDDRSDSHYVISANPKALAKLESTSTKDDIKKALDVLLGG